MAKISHHFKISSEHPASVYWKKELICSLLPFPHIDNLSSEDSAFIIASGPSLIDIDIAPLHDQFTFGVNGSIVKFNENNIVPSFYVIGDEDFIFNRPEILTLILQNKDCHFFFTAQVLNAICTINPDLLRDNKKITLFGNHFKDYGKAALEFSDIVKLSIDNPDIITKDGRIGFSLNPELGVFTAHTVPYFALQIAYGLGFRTINLVGMDLGSPQGITRFYESGKSAMPSHLDRDYLKTILPSFEIVSDLCNKNVFKVFNLSPISRLPNDIIEKKNFNDVVKNC